MKAVRPSFSFSTARYFVSLIALSISCQANAGWFSSEWREYRSDNFLIYSDNGERTVKNMVADLERFRDAALMFTGQEERDENAHMRVVMFSSRSEFEDFAGDRLIAGAYKHTDAGPLMIVAPESRYLDNGEVLFHEYIHSLFRERSAVNYPRWYSEGFAELLSTTWLRRKKVVIGRMSEMRAHYLVDRKILSVKDLLVPEPGDDEDEFWLRFYATSWLLTHYLQLGSMNGGPDHQQNLRAYITLLNDGVPPMEAFDKGFDMSVEALDKALMEYKRRRLMGVSFAVPEYTGAINVTTLDENEERFLLADIARLAGDEALSMRYLEEVGVDTQGAERALSLKAILLQHNEQYEQSEPLIAASFERAPEDYYVLLNATHYWLDKMTRDESAPLDADLYRTLVEHGTRAAALAGERYEVYRYLWRAHRQADKPLQALKSMMAAYKVEPTDMSLNFTIGSFLMERQRPDLALPFLESVLSWSHHGEFRDGVEQLVEQARRSSMDSAAANSP